jgi:peptidylprolyl isomerase
VSNFRLQLVVALALLVPASAPGAAPPAASSAASDWRDVDPNNLVLIDTRYGEVAVELAPEFAPNHVARMRALVRARFYDGKSFYRVIDGFVAQGGVGEGTASTGKKLGRSADTAKAWPLLKAEFDAPLRKDTVFTPLGSPDPYAPESGHVDGFPAGRDAKAGRMWIAHCPGTFAFARDNGDDTAATEFYIVIGEAPRRLDRNLTAFGRVIDGMQYVQKLMRGDPDIDSGVIADPKARDPILRVRIAADMPEGERPRYQVMRSDAAVFAALKHAKMHPAPAFYHRPPLRGLDLCLAPVPVRRIAAS